jgi:HSP20 family protein
LKSDTKDKKTKESAMNLRSLVPSGNGGNPARSPAPVTLFGSLYRDIDRLVDEFARSPLVGQAQVNLVPSIDISEIENEIVVSAEMPGLERGDVDISIEDDILTIRGEKKIEQEKDDKNYHLSERLYGVFYRALQLPPGVDASKIQATMSNGVLKITIPKPAKAQPQKIEVQEGAKSASRSESGSGSGNASGGTGNKDKKGAKDAA